MRFESKIDGDAIACTLEVDRDMAAPVLCFSGMAPMTAWAGGEKIGGCGSFTEVQLPDLRAGEPYRLTLAYDDYEPVNRAWLPMGAYLRVEGEIVTLPHGPLGARHHDFSGVPDYDGLRLVPPPAKWKKEGGTTRAPGAHNPCAEFSEVAALAERQGIGPFLDEKGVPVEHRTVEMPAEGYRITLSRDRIIVEAGDSAGRFHAGITLLTLLRTHAGALPCGVIEDAPRFGWRGQHLDCARHFYEVGTILDLLDLMALLKMNRFHWHFADDEAFRLEIDSFPDLWQRTRIRGEGELIPGIFGGGARAGGSYAKRDAQAIVDRAKALCIEVLPEIEVPAHALAMGRVFPEVRDPDDTGTERSVQGYPRNAMNPAMPKTWEVLEAIAEEVGALFPFGHLHLGCDELPKETWLGSPKARALMQREGLAGTDDLQGWTMARLAKGVAANGQRPAAWEEAARGSNGGIGNGAILFSWTGQGPGLEAAAQGYDVVMCPGRNAYLDMARSGDPDDWGASWAGFVSLADTVDWDPLPEGRPDLAERILGVQGCFWSEFTTRDAQMWPMLMPRMLGLASMAWSEVKPAPEVLERLAKHHRAVWSPRGETVD